MKELFDIRCHWWTNFGLGIEVNRLYNDCTNPYGEDPIRCIDLRVALLVCVVYISVPLYHARD